jgi:hypothetical protein
MNDDMGLTLLHNLQHMDCKIWPRDPISGKVVVFGGDILPSDSAPIVFIFDKNENNLFMRVHLPPAPLLQIIKKYKPSLCNDQIKAFVWGASNKKTDAITSTWMILIPMEWAPMFVDGPNFGTVFRCLVDLFILIGKIEQDHLMPLLEMVALACCGTDTLPNAVSTLSTHWTQLKNHVTTREWAEKSRLVHLTVNPCVLCPLLLQLRQ